MILQAQQVAIGRSRVDAHKHRVAGLENLVVGTNPDAGQITAPADRLGRFHGAAHVAQGNVVIEEIAEQLDEGPV